jgi:predicted TIM-barrel fold metal-dependent hydrolase
MPVIDAHIHLGANRHTKCYPPKRMLADLAEAGADGAVVFAFPEDMYRKTDTPQARAAANEYVLDISRRHPRLYPFYFVWTDYALPDNLGEYVGVKWHRHEDEPAYDYSDPRCEAFLCAMAELRMPVTLEEEFDHTAALVERVADTGITVIIPHMGLLNGGHRRMAAFFDCEHVCFDTSCAEARAIEWVLARVGPERVIFGSDVSGTSEPFFNFPRVERAKLAELGLTPESQPAIFGGNILRLIGRTPAGSGTARGTEGSVEGS